MLLPQELYFLAIFVLVVIGLAKTQNLPWLISLLSVYAIGNVLNAYACSKAKLRCYLLQLLLASVTPLALLTSITVDIYQKSSMIRFWTSLVPNFAFGLYLLLAEGRHVGSLALSIVVLSGVTLGLAAVGLLVAALGSGALSAYGKYNRQV